MTQFPLLFFFTSALFLAAFHDPESSNDVARNFRLNRCLSNRLNVLFSGVVSLLLRFKFANLVLWASSAAKFISVTSSSQLISLTEWDTGLPYLFGPWFFVCLLLLLTVVSSSSLSDSSENPGGEQVSTGPA